MPDKPKNKPAKKIPAMKGAPKPKALGFDWAHTLNPFTIKSPAHTMKIGGPEHNTNTGQEHLSKGMAERAKKDANRRPRNKGRS